MAKKMSSVDKALEVSRKNRVPKKPVKTKGKKTVPAVLDWGTGIPEDKLAYLNDDEMALLQAHRMFKGKRSVDGVPAFPDPGDTAAGSSKSTGPDRGPTGGPSSSPSSSGAGGLGGGSKGDSGGSPGGSPSSGGSNSSPSSGQSSPSSGAGGQKSPSSSGPGGGSLSAPARTAPSAAPSGPGGFGPRQSNMPGNPVSNAPSTQSWQGALDRIAQGSTVIGNPSNQKQITDRVPQAAPSTVKYSQAPTTPTPTAYGPSVAPVEDPFQQRYAKTASYLGAVTPTAKPAYQPSDMRGLTRSASALSGPNVGLGYSPTAPSSVSQPDYMAGANSPFADPATVSYDRNIQDALNAQAAANSAKAMSGINPQTGLAYGQKIQDRLSGSVAGSPVYSGPISIGQNISGIGNYADAVTNAPVSKSVQPASAPAPSYTGNVFNKSPTQQAEDIRRAVALAQGPAPSKLQNQSGINVPGYPGAQADISPSQGDYSPSQAPAYDVSPSQQSGWTSAQRDAYLGSLGNSKTGQVPLPQSQQQTQAGVAAPAIPPTTLAPLPDWVDYSYLYNDYPQLAMGVNPSIGAFNQYNATFRRGGRVGDSIEAALRLALQGIVSRNKTS